MTDMPVEAFREVIDVCLPGAFIVAKHAGRNLRPGGALVSISSLNGRQPAAGMSAYCAAKAGLSMLTQVAALELGPRGIRVNAVAPGFVHTPLTEPAAAVPGVLEEYLENTALGRAGAPEDIADARALPMLACLVVADRRGARPQRRRPPEALSRHPQAR